MFRGGSALLSLRQWPASCWLAAKHPVNSSHVAALSTAGALCDQCTVPAALSLALCAHSLFFPCHLTLPDAGGRLTVWVKSPDPALLWSPFGEFGNVQMWYLLPGEAACQWLNKAQLRTLSDGWQTAHHSSPVGQLPLTSRHLTVDTRLFVRLYYIYQPLDILITPFPQLNMQLVS